MSNKTCNILLSDTPSIEEKKAKVVNESNKVSLTREIYSNPLSNVSWFDGSNLLKSEVAVNISILVIEEAKCTDTKNLTLTASNALQRNVSSLVELIVNCEYSCYIIAYSFSE